MNNGWDFLTKYGGQVSRTALNETCPLAGLCRLFAVFLPFFFKQSLVSCHGCGCVILGRDDLIATEQERLNEEILGGQVVNTMQRVPVVDIAEHHQVML